LRQPDGVNKVANSFFDFSSKELIKSGRSKFVDEVFDGLDIAWKTECEMNVNVNVGIVFCWAAFHWGIVVDGVLGHHTSHSFPERKTPSSSWGDLSN
jgi:hypothetical protein